MNTDDAARHERRWAVDHLVDVGFSRKIYDCGRRCFANSRYQRAIRDRTFDEGVIGGAANVIQI